ncbi:hypothetical protein K456DRAFT_58500 [Colletotrichum gloeosporioides 23]|nr:hypothetical protein K456DRAFT_58500 [Colletotrichum gloeosporioides 23]
MSEDSSALAALSALLGYIGAEAATIVPFRDLLWPHRYLSNLQLSNLPSVALLMPIGGLLHKAVLETFDVAHRNGLFKGHQRGHMLGTPFFPSSDWTYIVHDPSKKANGPPQAKECRNCLWTTALGLLSIPNDDTGGRGANRSSELRAEKGEAAVRCKPSVVRARITVKHLTFSSATLEDRADPTLLMVRERCRTPGWRTFLTVILAESTSIAIAAIVAGAWTTAWSTLWLAPVCLRLLGTAVALRREPLAPLDINDEAPPLDFELTAPQSSSDLILFTGPPAIVLQFMRHYGHPMRSWPREVVQLLVAVGIGFVFPVGLVASALWMPAELQFVWFGYQVYLCLVLHLARYTPWMGGLSTHAAVAQAFDRQGVGIGTKGGTWRRTILFGENRGTRGTVRVDLDVTYHDRQADGKEALERLLRRREDTGMSHTSSGQ